MSDRRVVGALRLPSAGLGARARRLLCTGLLAVLLASAGVARADAPVVRAILFFLPSCGHCHQVMTVDLPPLMATHGDALQIAIIDVSLEQGGALYEAAVARFGLEDRRGVPTLIVGDVVLVGSVEIPERFPGLVDELLAAGGVDWPDIPGLAEAIGAAGSAPPSPSPAAPRPSSASPDPSEAAGAATSPATPGPTAGPAPTVSDPSLVPADGPLDRLARDPVANTLALVVLGLTLAALAWAAAVVVRAGAASVARSSSGLVPLLAIVGLGVAAYLAFVETTSVEAVCGPVGDCNTVQQSELARLFGVVPIGVLGLAGYAAIIAAWVLGRRGGPGVARVARLALLAMAFAGAAFSAYLTFLEPFVIGATCAWCLTSAVIMTAILVVAVRPAADPAPARSEARGD